MATLGTLVRSLSPAGVIAAIGRNWRLLVGAIVLVAVGGGVWAGYDWYQAHREAEARAAMVQAYTEIRKVESGSKDRDEAVRKMLERLSVEQKGTKVGGEALVRLGNRLYEAGKFDEARDTFAKYLQEYSGGPLHAAAAIGKAYAEESKGDLPAAEKTLQAAADTYKADPMLGEVQMNLARIFEQAKKSDEALKLYGQVAEKYPQSQWAQQAMERMGRLKSK
jgi:predicted negative regulator of RcsB-dependent stress response